MARVLRACCRLLRLRWHPHRGVLEGSEPGQSRGPLRPHRPPSLTSRSSQGTADTTEDVKADSRFARHAFGAQFAEVQVDLGTGQVRVLRMLGVFAAGRIIDPDLARSQLIGGMTMGLGMALMEETVVDAE